MISQEEKDKIKEEIVTKVNSILEKNNESYRMDKVNVLNKADSVKFMGTYRHMAGKSTIPSGEINTFLKKFL